MNEAFLFSSAVYRLRGRTRRTAVVLLVLGVLPSTVIAGHPIFPWAQVSGLPAVAALAVFTAAGGGLALLLLAQRVKRGVTLATSVATALCSAWALLHFGGSAAAWEALALPPSVTERPLPALLSMAACSAGIHLAFKPTLRRESRILLLAGLGLAALYYLLPVRGEAPATALIEMFGHMGELPHWRFKLGFVVIGVLLAFPGLMALAAQHFLRRTPILEQPGLALATLYGLPLMLGMLLYRAIPMGGGSPWPFLLACGQLALLSTLLPLVSSTLEVLCEGLVSPHAHEAEQELAPGPTHRRLMAAHLGGLAILMVGLAWASAPPHKGVSWSPGPPTQAGDALFGERLPAFSEARRLWDGRVRRESGALELVRTRKAGEALLEAAREVHPELGGAFEAMVRESASLDLAGRRWYGLVGGINEASRAAGLPYYVDPTVLEYATADGLRRHFRTLSYRISAVATASVEGREYAALHVERLGEAQRHDARLGFSRDQQPFALVVTDEIAAWSRRLEAGRCGLDDDPGGLFARCDALLARLRATPDFDLPLAITRMTERHEIQHQIDGPELPMPTAVVRIASRWDDETRQRVNRELSAYLIELTLPDVPPGLALAHMLPFALNPGSAESLVALLIFEGLTSRSLYETRSGRVDENNVLAAFDTLADWPEDTLRERAAALRNDWY